MRFFPNGIIPACAGSTKRFSSTEMPFRDHPRMCGEHLDAGSEQKPCPGSSPHVRGALLRLLIAATIGGIIPACAGSTALLTVDSSTSGDHPRMCGEHSLSKSIVMLKEGSSPHVRGALPACPPRSSLSGIIPACAGSTFSYAKWTPNTRDHPRMCGEHDGVQAILTTDKGSSPHVRGAPFSCGHNRLISGIIPACAGSTSCWTVCRA